MSKPDLLEMLKLKNPYDPGADTYTKEGVRCGPTNWAVYNRAAEDILGRMEKFHVPSRSYLQVYSEELSTWTSQGEHDGPGCWAWIPTVI